MKKIMLTLAITLNGMIAFSQSQYEVTADTDGGRIFKGVISRDLIEKDTAFYNRWYAINYRAFSPNPAAVNGLKKMADSIQIIAFMGTWCEDSHFIIPKLFHLMDAAGLGNNKLSLIGTDRNKKTLGNLSEAVGVTNVPTIILMKNGKELGRVIEYGKSGQFDKELGEILTAASQVSR